MEVTERATAGWLHQGSGQLPESPTVSCTERKGSHQEIQKPGEEKSSNRAFSVFQVAGSDGETNLIEIEEGQNRTQVTRKIEVKTETNDLDHAGRGTEPGVPSWEGEIGRSAGVRYWGRQPDLQGLGSHGAWPGRTRVFLEDEPDHWDDLFQGEIVDSIEANVENASLRVNEGAEQLRMAERWQVYETPPPAINFFSSKLTTKTFYAIKECLFVLRNFKENSLKVITKKRSETWNIDYAWLIKL